MPSGIFEDFQQPDNWPGAVPYVNCDKDHLAKRTKEVSQSRNRGGWITFLLQNVNMDWPGTDLAKLFLGTFFYEIKHQEPNPHIKCKADEFAEYLHDFGISRTIFWSPKNDYKPHPLAVTFSGHLVGAELLGRVFFLPLPVITRNPAELEKLVTKCADAVLEYKRRNDLHLPPWIEEIEFQTEKNCATKLITSKNR